MGESLKKISASTDAGIIVAPRRPYKDVWVCSDAFVALQKAQKLLDVDGIKLVLTRGYENQGHLIKCLHAVARLLGATLFLFCYPHRRREIREIFSPNGHDKSGNCVDVSLSYRGKIIGLLPRGVFTSRTTTDHMQKTHADILNSAWKALESVGFAVHPNRTEALQIHCEFKSCSPQ